MLLKTLDYNNGIATIGSISILLTGSYECYTLVSKVEVYIISAICHRCDILAATAIGQGVVLVGIDLATYRKAIVLGIVPLVISANLESARSNLNIVSYEEVLALPSVVHNNIGNCPTIQVANYAPLRGCLNEGYKLYKDSVLALRRAVV